MAKKKYLKQHVDKDQYELNINEPMMVLIQKTTGQSTFEIVSYFNTIMLKQCKEIRATNSGKNVKNKYYSLYQKKSYGYYPGTNIYFTSVTSENAEQEVFEDNGIYANTLVGKYTLWVCNVSLPRGTMKFSHEELKKLLAEGILVGDAACPTLEAPHKKKLGRRDTLEELPDLTESTED